MGLFTCPTRDLSILQKNIVKSNDFLLNNESYIEEAYSNQNAILKEIWTEEQAEAREEQGFWSCVSGVLTVVAGGAAIVLSGGAATPVVLGVATIGFGASNTIEGGQDIYYGSISDISSKSFNPLRDTVFLGNETVYNATEMVVTFSASASIPIANASRLGNVLTTSQKAKIVGVELGKEVLGTTAGFVATEIGQEAGLSRSQSMILGMASSIVTTKGADWVDNNFDNLVLATKNTFNNQGKTVKLGSNGGNIISDFSNEFKKAKANNVSSVKDIEVDSNANAINGSGDVIEGVTEAGYKEVANVGKLYKGQGTVIDTNPVSKLTGIFKGNTKDPYHFINRIIEREVSAEIVYNTFKNPDVILSQWKGQRYLYLTDKAAVAVTKDGQLVTTWARSDFGEIMEQILKEAK